MIEELAKSRSVGSIKEEGHKDGAQEGEVKMEG
jgi:hypothetical protein